MGDSIRVSSPSLPSASMDLSIPQFNALESNPMEPLAYSPAYSSSSLSDPPTEPNSPILFNVNSILKLEDAEDNFDISSEVANYTPLDSPTMNRTLGLGARARVSGDRKIDPCADEGWVAALRVAHAADQTVGLSDDLSIIHARNLRTTLGRLNRVKNTFSAAGSPPSGTSLNGSPVDSKKRRRSNTRTHSNNIAPDGVSMAIKKEMLETGDGIGIDDSIPISLRTGGRRKGKTPVKKQKIDSTPETIPRLAPMPYDPRSNEEGITTSLAVDGTTPSEKGRKKRPRRLTYAYVIEEVVENQPDDGTRGSVPPNFTFRYDIPHTPLWIGKGPLRSSRYWSEGAEGPRNPKPIGDVFQKKDGLLTDFVSIIESRLRPRKSTGNPPAGRDSETEESSDDLTVTEDEGGTDDDLDIDGESIDLSVSIEGGEHGLENSSLKRQKLNTGESSSTGASRETPRNNNKNKESAIITDIKDVDERTWPGAISMVDGRCMVPVSCAK